VLVDVPVDSPIMQEEVFGPILPVLEIESIDEVIDWVNERPRPLGLYVFAEEEDVAERILDATNSGDACVNDCARAVIPPKAASRARLTSRSRRAGVAGTIQDMSRSCFLGRQQKNPA
jgi:acyl-CoA reductase-like NAD-dependent aldehyde dehydrogenase